MSNYSKKNKVLFIHVPKAAGSSMEAIPEIGGSGHEPFWSFQDKLGQKVVKKAFSFGFVRNPLSRLVSFQMASLLIGNEPPFEADPNRISFKEAKFIFTTYLLGFKEHKEFTPPFFYECLRKPGEPLPHMKGWPFHIHWLPMWWFLCDRKKNIAVDFVGRFETLDEDWYYAREKIGVNKDLPHLRSTKNARRPYEDYYTQETEEIVRTLYRRDFELFGYD